jgi:hypothetical protein
VFYNIFSFAILHLPQTYFASAKITIMGLSFVNFCCGYLPSMWEHIFHIDLIAEDCSIATEYSANFNNLTRYYYHPNRLGYPISKVWIESVAHHSLLRQNTSYSTLLFAHTWVNPNYRLVYDASFNIEYVRYVYYLEITGDYLGARDVFDEVF